MSSTWQYESFHIDRLSLLGEYDSPRKRSTLAIKIPANYPHRRNADGSYDSVCMTCFATVASAKTEDELLPYERKHICAISALSQRGVHGSVTTK